MNQKCPICGMDVTNSTITSTYKGKIYKLCCPECQKKFEEKPKQYAAP